MIASIKFRVNNAGSVLRNIRLANGMSQTCVAEQLDFSSPSTISHFERGARHITLEKLEAVANVLGFDVYIVMIKKEVRP